MTVCTRSETREQDEHEAKKMSLDPTKMVEVQINVTTFTPNLVTPASFRGGPGHVTALASPVKADAPYIIRGIPVSIP